MSDGRKLIMSPFTGRKKRKAQNKTREKYMPEERRPNLAETDRGSYYKTRGMVRSILRRKKCISAKQRFLKISQIPQENTCAGVSFK